jgi:protein-tyrosine phosphatase
MRERAIAFTNVFNFRDLGGYLTGDGRSLRWGRLYRSDDLSRLGTGAGDHGRFAELGIRTVVDLRRPHEIAEDGRIPEYDGCTYHHVHLTHAHWPPTYFGTTAERADFVVERYLLLTEEAADGIGQALRLIADEDAAPLVVHCIAGKDRTGVVSALTLALLGVDDEVIAADYELSELAEAASWTYLTRDQPERQADRWKHITVSPREGMLRFLADLRARHGSVEAYAASVGLTDENLAAMRAHLLEDAPDPPGVPAKASLDDALDPAVRVDGPAALDVHKGRT